MAPSGGRGATHVHEDQRRLHVPGDRRPSHRDCGVQRTCCGQRSRRISRPPGQARTSGPVLGQCPHFAVPNHRGAAGGLAYVITEPRRVTSQPAAVVPAHPPSPASRTQRCGPTDDRRIPSCKNKRPNPRGWGLCGVGESLTRSPSPNYQSRCIGLERGLDVIQGGKIATRYSIDPKVLQ